MKDTAGTFYRDLGHRIKITRMELGLSEAEAAAAHGVTLRNYQKWEAGGRHKGGHYKLLAFCQRYDVNIAWFYGGASRVKANLASPN
jgi:transcriptional regulator with XRE-family HTH domain